MKPCPYQSTAEERSLDVLHHTTTHTRLEAIHNDYGKPVMHVEYGGPPDKAEQVLDVV